MIRKVKCVKLGKELDGLDYVPYPGELGQKIYDSISQQAWDMWLGHQTILINEYRLSLVDPKSREFLEKEMQKFLFGDGSDKPKEFTAPE